MPGTDPSQVKASIIKNLAEIVPPPEQGKSSDPKSEVALAGQLVLGEKLLKDLGSNELEFVDK